MHRNGERSGRTGHMVTLHRRLSLPCYPDAEAGPAAIGGLWRELPCEVVKVAEAIQNGEDMPGLGARAGVRQSVVVLSPMVPGLAELAARVDWRLWERGPFPKIDADAFIVWRPLQIMRGVRLANVRETLVNAAFGGGAVYPCFGVLWDMIHAHRGRKLRRYC